MWRDGPLRVGYVTKRYPRYSETFVVAEISAHEAAGLDVEIFSLFPPNDTHFQDAIAHVRAPVCYLPSHGVKAVDLWAALEDAAATLPGMWGELEAARGVDALSVCQAAVLACEVRRRGIGHLHAHFATAPVTVTRLASRLAKVPYTFTAHAKDIFHQSVRPEDLQRKLGDAAAVVTVSDYNRDYLIRTYGAAAARVQRIYNGLDLEQFRYESPMERPPRIAAVGRLVEKKGFADLVEACAILRARGVAFRCEIVGTGPLEPACLARARGIDDELLGRRRNDRERPVPVAGDVCGVSLAEADDRRPVGLTETRGVIRSDASVRTELRAGGESHGFDSTRGLRTFRPGNLLKSLSAVHSSATPCCRQRAAIRAS